MRQSASLTKNLQKIANLKTSWRLTEDYLEIIRSLNVNFKVTFFKFHAPCFTGYILLLPIPHRRSVACCNFY